MRHIMALAFAASMSLVSTAAWAGGPTMWAIGTCPGGGLANISISSATPGGTVILAWSATRGSTSVPGGSCAGLNLGLDRARVVGTFTAEPDGRVFISRDLPERACNTFLQAIDVSTCQATAVTEVITLY